MNIKDFKKRYAKLDLIDLDYQTYLWHCPNCGKELIINHEQVCRMIHHQDETILCEKCDKLALFIVKRNDKYLYYGPNSKGEIAKKWTTLISEAKKYSEEEAKAECINDSYSYISISHALEEV